MTVMSRERRDFALLQPAANERFTALSLGYFDLFLNLKIFVTKVQGIDLQQPCLDRRISAPENGAS
jgi:hypothetical protein